MNMSKVICEVSCWRFLAGWCSTAGRLVEIDSDQIKTLTENNLLYYMGDSWYIQNIQINKVIGGKENCVFFMKKITYRLLGPPNTLYQSSKFEAERLKFLSWIILSNKWWSEGAILE